MAKLKLGPIADDKPVKVTVELPAALHRDLTEYGRILAEGASPVEPPLPTPPSTTWSNGANFRSGSI